MKKNKQFNRLFLSLKNLILLIVLMIATQSISFAQVVATDEQLILQECIDLPSIQQYYPLDNLNAHQQVRIMQFPYAFSNTIQLSKFGQPVVFGQRDNLTSVDAFINFFNVTINGNTAAAYYIFNINRNTALPESLKINVNLEKNGNNWTIVNSTINN